MGTLHRGGTYDNTRSCILDDGLALLAHPAHEQIDIWSHIYRYLYQRRYGTALSCNEVKEQEEKAGVFSKEGTPVVVEVVMFEALR